MGRAVLLGVACAAGFVFASCGIEDPNASEDDPQVGSLSMNLEVADGIDLESVSYTVTGDGAGPMTGTLPVLAGPAPIKGVITGVPLGKVQLDLKGTARNGILCEGSGGAHVVRGRLALIAIILHCLARKHRGNIDVHGEFNVCPEAELATCTLARSSIGEPIALSAKGSDPDGDTVAFSWTASSGTFSNPATSDTQYTCTTPGTQTLAFTVDDGHGCEDKHEFTVFCAKPASGMPRCGNGKTDTGEECDDGNKTSGDGCAPDCTAEMEDESALCGPDTSGFIPRCACDRCSDEIDAAESVQGDATNGPAAGTSKAELAVALIACTQESGCRGVVCLCGDVPEALCLPSGVATGPCATEYLAAAETSDAQSAFGARNDLNLAVGLATAVETCTIAECDPQCP